MVDKKEESDIKPSDLPCVENFDQLGVKEELLRGIYGYGFEKPSVIQ